MTQEKSISAAELAERLNGRLHGDGKRIVREVAPLPDAGPHSLCWAQSDVYLKQAAQSNAGVVLIPQDAEPVESTTCICVEDVDLALRQVLEWFAPPAVGMEEGVHATAVVAESAAVDGAMIGPRVYVGEHARIGKGTQLHPGVHVGPHSSIGRDCVLWPNVVVRERITIGDRVIIHPNATIGSDGFGYIFRDGRHLKLPQIGEVVIEDDVEIGAGSAIDRAKCGCTRIGRGTKIDNLVQIAHNVSIGPDCVVVAQCGISGSATLGRHVVLAGQVGLGDHVRLGDGVQVAGGSGVGKSVDAGEIVRGSPAVPIRKYKRQQAAVRKLPEWFERLRALEKRVERLESSADH